jgi:D-alanyl-D-alanine carboxypeptidase
MIIKKVTGHHWSAEVNARIVAPLGLSGTVAPLDDPDLPSPHANGYQHFGDGAPLVDVTLMNQSMADAAGSLVSTTSDLTKFWRALQEGKLLGPVEMAEMHKTVPAPEFAEDVHPGERYGLGIMWFPASCGGGFWTHFGDTLGFANANAVSDDGSRVVVVSETTMPETHAVYTEDFQLIDDVICAAH